MQIRAAVPHRAELHPRVKDLELTGEQEAARGVVLALALALGVK
jgi:hypothetical protein